MAIDNDYLVPIMLNGFFGITKFPLEFYLNKDRSLVTWIFQGIYNCLMFALQVMNLIGDVKGKVAVMVDDMIDTAGRPSSMPNLTFEMTIIFLEHFITYSG